MSDEPDPYDPDDDEDEDIDDGAYDDDVEGDAVDFDDIPEKFAGPEGRDEQNIPEGVD